MTGAELERRTTRRLTPAIVLANVGGAVVVFVFLAFLQPPMGAGDPEEQRRVNAAVFVVFLTVSIVAGRWWGVRAAESVVGWLISEAQPDPAIRRHVLRQPLRQMRVNGSIWLSAAVIFGLLNLPYTLAGSVDIALTIVLGGFTTCTIAYLLSERILRPVVSRAMAGSGEPPPVLLGIKPRLLLAWGVGTGIPLVGIGLGVLAPGPQEPLSRAAILFLVAIGVVVGLGSVTAAAGAVSDPVRSVATALRDVGQGRLDVSVPVYDASEVGQLQSGFNAMVEGLRERDRVRDLFGRQVGDDVARRAIQHGPELGGETRDVAVLFVDVVGSTSLADSVDPQEVVRRLNAFFAVVIDVVTQHSGWINKFEGDAALCIFGAPVEQPHARADALSAARHLAQALRPLAVEAAIGVSAGSVVAGNVGAESRFEYTVIGDPVNAAARLTELAKASAGSVLADADVVEAAGPDEAGHWVDAGEQVLRGRRQPTRLARPR